MATGKLRAHVVTASDSLPIEGARVLTRDKQGNLLFDQLTDANGMTDYVDLEAPDPSLTLNPETAARSYSIYDVEVTAAGFHPVIVHDVEIIAGTSSYLPVFMHPNLESDINNNITRVFRRNAGPADDAIEVSASPFVEAVGEPFEDMVIDVPPPAVLQDQQAGRVGTNQAPVRQVFIPREITVHLGVPTNTAARNVRVPFVEYVANVASSEIFPTWPDASLRANIHAIVTFALNRIYTEWYRSRGFNFDITNSTRFDQYYVHGRNIFENLRQISAEIFNQYVRRIGFRNPFFTSYCNGTTSTCAGMSQWGTVTLANQGMTPLQILRRFYGQDIELVTTNNIQDVRTTYPGTPLRLNSNNRYVQLMQQYLNRIRQNFPLIPLIANPNGFFGPDTEAAVRQFQRTFGITVDGVIGPATWNRITQIWVGVTRLAELNAEGERIGIGPTPPNVVLRNGSSGENVRQLQWLLNYIGYYYEFITPVLVVDGRFGPNTENAVREFQRNFGLNPDGIVGPATWNRLYEVFRSITASTPRPPEPPLPPQPPTPPPTPGEGIPGTVTTASGNLNVRSAPNTGAPIIGQLARGQTINVLEERNGWYRINFNGRDGWVSGDFVTLSGTGTVTTQGGNLNLRANPSTAAPIVGSIPNGAQIPILGVSGNWFLTTFGGTRGWVSRDFVRI